eukprot:14826031-Alexandrium_andersonii.AAC.1
MGESALGERLRAWLHTSIHRSEQLHIQTAHWLKLRMGLHSIWMRSQSPEAPQGETPSSRA